MTGTLPAQGWVLKGHGIYLLYSGKVMKLKGSAGAQTLVYERYLEEVMIYTILIPIRAQGT